MMRKLLIVILILACLSSIATSISESAIEPNKGEKEILFRNLPWLEDVMTINSLIGDFGIYKRDPEEAWYVYTWNNLDLRSDFTLGYDIGIVGDENTLVAGHMIDVAKMYFLYDFDGSSINTDPKETHFYIAQYEFKTNDVESTYDDLFSKLSVLYGEAIVDISFHSGLYFKTEPAVSYKGETRTAIWHGANNTAVKIIAEINDPEERVSEVKEATETIEMWYGKTNMDETIRQMEAFLENEAIGTNRDSKDGL